MIFLFYCLHLIHARLRNRRFIQILLWFRLCRNWSILIHRADFNWVSNHGSYLLLFILLFSLTNYGLCFYRNIAHHGLKVSLCSFIARQGEKFRRFWGAGSNVGDFTELWRFCKWIVGSYVWGLSVLRYVIGLLRRMLTHDPRLFIYVQKWH